jgi:hypothetical protein
MKKNIVATSIALSSLLSGCATAPVDNSEALAKIRTITIACCDFKDEVNVLPETKASMVVGFAGALSGGVLGAIGAGILTGGVGLGRTNSFYSAAQEKPLNPHRQFTEDLEASLAKRGVTANILFPRFFDGYENKYQLVPTEIKGEAVLELRYIANIANTDDRFFPSVAVQYRLLSVPDRRELARGVVASSDSGVKVAFGDKTPFSAPSIGPLRQGAGDLSKTGTIFDLPPERVVVGNSDALYANAKKMYADVLTTSREVAEKLAGAALKR